MLFVDGSTRFIKGKSQNEMTAEDVEALVSALRPVVDAAMSALPNLPVRLVQHAEIKENDWDLNIGRYVAGTETSVLDVSVALSELSLAQSAVQPSRGKTWPSG